MLKNFLFPLFLTGAFLQAEAVRVELRNPVSGTITHTTQDGVVDARTTMSMLGRIVKGDLRDRFRQLVADLDRHLLQTGNLFPANTITTLNVSFLRVGGHAVLPGEQFVLPADVGPYDGTTIAFDMVVHVSAVPQVHQRSRDLPATRAERFVQWRDAGRDAGDNVGGLVGAVVIWGEIAIQFGFYPIVYHPEIYCLCGLVGMMIGLVTGPGCGVGCFTGIGCVMDTVYGCGRQLSAVMRRNFLSAGENRSV